MRTELTRKPDIETEGQPSQAAFEAKVETADLSLALNFVGPEEQAFEAATDWLVNKIIGAEVPAAPGA